ncbi:MAG: Flp pilus assembly protein CpaB [Terriglobales bacterium]
MDRRRFVIIGVLALGLAAVVSLGVLQFLRGQRSSTGATAKVVVAARALMIGQKIEDSDVSTVELPVSQLPKDVFVKREDVVGRGVIIPVSERELILNSKLAPREAGAGLPPKIPQGMRAVSVRVREDISVAGFVIAGTRVDVMLTGNIDEKNDPKLITTVTILENVEVLTANQELQSDGTPKRDTTVVTLLVAPEDAQTLTLAVTQGKIHLALRNPLDRDESKPKATLYGNLYTRAGFGEVALEGGRPKTVAIRTPRGSGGKPVEKPPAQVVQVIKGDKVEQKSF